MKLFQLLKNMATTFYKLKEGDKFYRIDFVYDENEQLIDYIKHDFEMARDASIENYKVRFICYDRTFNKNTMFTYDVQYNDSSKYLYLDDDNNVIKLFITTSKKRCDAECKKLDNELGKTETNGKEGQDC